MKNKFNKARYSLYILLPLVFFAVIHLVFAYANWDINPSNWSEFTRGMSAIVGVGASAIGVVLAGEITEQKQKH